MSHGIRSGSGVEELSEPPQSPLSYTQHLVLVRIAGGLTNAAIGLDLRMSEDTVKSHVGRIFRKLNVDDRAHAVAVGYQSRLLGHDVHDASPVPIPAHPARIQSGGPQATLPRPAKFGARPADEIAFRHAVGEKFRELRELRHWTVRETSQSIGLDWTTLVRVESGERSPNVDRLFRLCSALGISPVDVVQQALDAVFPQGWPYTVEPP